MFASVSVVAPSVGHTCEESSRFSVSQLEWGAEVEVPNGQPHPEPAIESQRVPLTHFGDTQPFTMPSQQEIAPVAFFCPWCVLPLHSGTCGERRCTCGVRYVLTVDQRGAVTLTFDVPGPDISGAGDMDVEECLEERMGEAELDADDACGVAADEECGGGSCLEAGGADPGENGGDIDAEEGVVEDQLCCQGDADLVADEWVGN